MIEQYPLGQKRLARQSGFTLLELLMVIAVIGVLASLAVPRFQNTTQKAKFTEVVNAATPYKTAVELCITQGVALTECNAGSNGIPASFTSDTGNVASVDVVEGVITATGASVFNTGSGTSTEAATYTLEPTATANSISWTKKGTCTNAGVELCN